MKSPFLLKTMLKQVHLPITYRHKNNIIIVYDCNKNFV